MMGKFPMTVAVIVKNEERRLEDCLKSVSWADEIVIVNDMSTDRTVEIAKKYTDKIFDRPMDIEGRQRNFAYSKATHDWVLSIDADERVTEELREEIMRILVGEASGQGPRHHGNSCAAYAIPIKTFLGSRWVKGAGYYPAEKVRLFRRDKFRYEEAKVHPRIFLDGKCGTLKGDILHYSWRNLSDFLVKFNRETSLEAEKWLLDGRKTGLAKILRKCVDRFLKNYFLKGGWLDGYLGFVMSLFHSLYQFISYAKYREARRGLAENPRRGSEGEARTTKGASCHSKLVFVDRDGVLNEDYVGDYVRRWEDFKFLPGILESLARLKKAGYRTVVVSNQAGIGEGIYTREVLDDITRRMRGEAAKAGGEIADVYYCVHGKQAGCECRKPKTGLFRQAAAQWSFDPAKTYFIGDKLSDIQAGKDFGLKTILVLTGYGRSHVSEINPTNAPDSVSESFTEAVDRILAE